MAQLSYPSVTRCKYTTNSHELAFSDLFGRSPFVTWWITVGRWRNVWPGFRLCSLLFSRGKRRSGDWQRGIRVGNGGRSGAQQDSRGAFGQAHASRQPGRPCSTGWSSRIPWQTWPKKLPPVSPSGRFHCRRSSAMTLRTSSPSCWKTAPWWGRPGNRTGAGDRLPESQGGS